MADEKSEADTPAPATSQSRESAAFEGPLTQADIHAVVNDPDIEPDDRQARLEAMARYVVAERGDSEPTFLEMQIREALALIAEGGHDYGASDPLGFDDETGDEDDRSVDEGAPVA